MRMGPWRLPTVRWPLLLLLASAGFTALGVVEANRSIRSQQRVAEHALHDYAGFVSWSYQQHLRELLAANTQEALGAVNHAGDMHMNARIPTAQSLPRYLPWNAQCGCRRARHGPSPAIYFAYVLGADTLGIAVNTRADPVEGWEADRPVPVEQVDLRKFGYSPSERRWLNDTITRQIRGTSDAGRFPIIVVERDSVERLLAYTLMPTTWGDTLVYGAEYTPKAVVGLLADVMYDRDLLPETFTRGRSIREVVQLEVSDARGNVLFESEPVSEWRLDDSTHLPAAFGSLRVRAQIRPEMAGTLLIGGLPRSRLPFLLGLLAVSTALAIVAAAQIRREGELARLRSDFVAGISHELRTPLAQMRLYLETLRLGRFTTEDQRAWSLENVERETLRLSQLVERVLRFSRTGLLDDEPRERVDAADEVRRIAEEFRPLAAARGVAMDIVVAPVPALLLRPAALRHVVLNALDNAVKYGPTGQTIRVRVRPVGTEVRVEITDEGPGIAERDRESVWLPYQRGSSASHVAGSGIGLAIVRDIAQQHGGRAWFAEPTDGRGALFVAAFPFADDSMPISVSRPASEPSVVAG
jgi:signal transduction histidine kinase